MSNKIFIIGLPRTGTTSVCNSFLELGYTTAHTAYTKKTLTQAKVIADTPIFSEYQLLDKQFSGAQFINLTRELSLWVPSIRQLLTRMYTNLTRPDGGFNIHIKRCYMSTFENLNLDKINSDTYLTDCYYKHQDTVMNYFKQRDSDLLNIDIAKADSGSNLQAFINNGLPINFTKMNAAGKVTAWNDLKHPSKIASTRNGKIDKSLGYDHKIL